MVFDIGSVILCIHGKQDNGWHENLLLKSPITRWETSRRDTGQTAARGRTVAFGILLRSQADEAPQRWGALSCSDFPERR
nr:MAG TPA: hypothetical protein [Caudoviricetes sp.]